MTDKQYPPLPDPEFSVRCIPSMRRGKERVSRVEAYTADQMLAYVDADRAQRLELTDAQCDAIVDALHSWAADDWRGDLGLLPLWTDKDRSNAIAIIRAALNNPSRPYDDKE